VAQALLSVSIGDMGKHNFPNSLKVSRGNDAWVITSGRLFVTGGMDSRTLRKAEQPQS
jgi:hypothetical protein